MHTDDSARRNGKKSLGLFPRCIDQSHKIYKLVGWKDPIEQNKSASLEIKRRIARIDLDYRLAWNQSCLSLFYSRCQNPRSGLKSSPNRKKTVRFLWKVCKTYTHINRTVFPIWWWFEASTTILWSSVRKSDILQNLFGTALNVRFVHFS